jgi:hypothetical protein
MEEVVVQVRWQSGFVLGFASRVGVGCQLPLRFWVEVDLFDPVRPVLPVRSIVSNGYRTVLEEFNKSRSDIQGSFGFLDSKKL